MYICQSLEDVESKIKIFLKKFSLIPSDHLKLANTDSYSYNTFHFNFLHFQSQPVMTVVQKRLHR